MTWLTLLLLTAFGYGFALIGYGYGHRDGLRQGYTRGRDIARIGKW